MTKTTNKWYWIPYRGQFVPAVYVRPIERGVNKDKWIMNFRGKRVIVDPEQVREPLEQDTTVPDAPKSKKIKRK